METVFQVSNFLTIPFWLLMIFAPTWRWSRRIMASLWTVVPISLLYAGLLAMSIGNTGVVADLMNPTLPTIAALLSTPEGATVGWAHFLAFDLFVGRWAYLESRERGYNPWLVSPTLFFVLMSGPFGLLLYLGLRWVLSRRAA